MTARSLEAFPRPAAVAWLGLPQGPAQQALLAKLRGSSASTPFVQWTDGIPPQPERVPGTTLEAARRHLLACFIDHARRCGIGRVWGIVPAGNPAMPGLARRPGFTERVDPDEDGCRRVELRLGPA